MSPGLALSQALLEALRFQPHETRLGNLTWGTGTVDARPVRVALVENHIASGSIGSAEADRLAALLRVATAERTPLVLFLDSAGARVSEGLQALAAFRRLYRAGIDAVYGGMPLACVLGRNCYGGSSMLAMLSPRRLLSSETRLAMSGPAIIATAAGTQANDGMFVAMAEAAMSPAARAQASEANAVWQDGDRLSAWLREAIAAPAEPVSAWQARHAALADRFDRAKAEAAWEPLRRRDLDRLYEGGYEIRESQGLLEGRGRRGADDHALLGIVGNTPLGLGRAWRFADLAWRHLASPPLRLEVLLDCASHAPRLEDERAILSEFIVDMAMALGALGARGTEIGLTILGKAGGGVYVALAAPARRVASVHGADIQVLPAAAVAAILGEGRAGAPSFNDYRAAGVADEEIKLGLVPGTA